LAVEQSDPEIAINLSRKAVIEFFGGLCLEFFTFRNHRAHNIHLCALLKHRLGFFISRRPVGKGPPMGRNRLSARRKFVNDAEVEIAVKRHRQSPRNWGRGHHEDIRHLCAFLFKVGPLLDSEAVLLINNDEP
jgi:hypothetical protein